MKSVKCAYLSYEIYKREFGPLLFLALELANSGWKVVIGHQQDFIFNLHKFEPGVFWLKSVKRTYRDWTKKIKAKGHKIIAQDVEGLFINKPIYIKRFVCRELLKRIDCFLVPRKDVFSELKKIKPLKSKLVFLEQIKKIYFQNIKRRKNRARSKKVIIGTEFVFGNHYLGLTSILKNFKGFYSSKDILKKIKNDLECMPLYLTMIKKICRANPQIKFIIRPHPSENTDYYKKSLTDVENCYVQNSEPIEHELHDAKGLISLRSTISYDAALLGVPCLIPWDRNFQSSSKLLYPGFSPDFFGHKTRFPEKLKFKMPKRKISRASIRPILENFNRVHKKYCIPQKKEKWSSIVQLIIKKIQFSLRTIKHFSYFKQKYKKLAPDDVKRFLIKLNKPKTSKICINKNNSFLEIKKNNIN